MNYVDYEKFPVRPSVRPSTWNNSIGSHYIKIFTKFDIWLFFWTLSRKFEFHYNMTTIGVTLSENRHAFWSFSPNYFFKIEIFDTKMAQKVKTTSNIFFSKIVPFMRQHGKIWYSGKGHMIIQGVPLATEPDISLIILTPMKILQRNLNRSRFVVWEMKRNVSAVCFKFHCNILISGRIINLLTPELFF